MKQLVGAHIYDPINPQFEDGCSSLPTIETALHELFSKLTG